MEPGKSLEIDELWTRGRQCWPEFTVTRERLSTFVAERAGELVVRDADAAAEDLYLACGCADGLTAALSAFDRRHGPGIAATLVRMGLPPSLRADVEQAVRAKLFVSSPSAPARICRYSGRGRLSSWVRTVAVRVAVDALRAEKSEEIPVESDVLDALAESDATPDLRALQQRYAPLVQRAFTAGFDSLTPRQRNLLRLHYLNQLNIDQLGTMHGVHRATAFRWLVAAREQVFQTARRFIATATPTAESDAEDLLRLLKSQLDLSLDRLLRATRSTGGEAG